MEVEIDPPHVHSRPHHHGPQRHWSEYAISLSALFVSLVSILIAWQHGEEMKKLVRANSFPYVQLYTTHIDQHGKRAFSLMVSNQGVGPADIRTAEVLWNGRPMASLDALLSTCCAGSSNSGIETSSLAGRMLRPGESGPYLVIPAAAQNDKLHASVEKAVADDGLETRVCFCSVFDECWVTTDRSMTRPKPVPQCPHVSVMFQP